MNVHVPYTQSGRMMAIATPLGPDVLLLDKLEIDEGINGLFTIHASVKSQRDDLQAGDLIGSTVDFSLQQRDGATRYWNGFVTEMHEGPLTTRGTRNYAMTVRPKLWLLSQHSDCRIFQNLASPQIIETLCKEHDISDFDLRITGKPAPQLYSVQWNETDLAYMLRRMEEDGLFYWHDHAQGKHTLVVADHYSGYRAASQPQVRYTMGSADQDRISDWRRRFAFTPGKRSGRDWNFLTMQTPAATQPSFANVPGNSKKELYEFPGRFADSTGAEQMMKNRIQATETGFETVEAVSTVRTLGPGETFTPYDTAKPDDVFGKQVVTTIKHVAMDPTYEAAGGQPHYDNAFKVMPATTAATPHRSIPRPKITGSQIALIAGPAGEEIHTDEYGRVKLKFPWDRRAVGDGSDTCWVRVGQPWAGGTWGHQVIPRVGMESLISYQEGDPDRPFVTALVPDPTNPTPYPLPDNKTRMTFRSNSYKSKGFNEMTFEDKTGSENIFFHAQKDHTTKIENNQTLSIGANHSQVVGQNQAMTVGQNMTFEAGKSINMAIGGTGAGVAPLMAPFVGMSGVTATMLGEALGGSSSGGGGAPQASAGPGGGQPSPADLMSGFESALTQSVGAMIAPLAGSLIGILNQMGIQAQQGVWNGPSPRPDAGTALAAAGDQLSQAVAALFSLPGMHNHVTGTMKTEHVGCARIEQVGTSKVTHVGANYSTRVGQDHGLSSGKNINVGAGKDWSLVAGDSISMTATQNISQHAGKAIGIVSDGEMYVAAKDDITVTAKTIGLHATDEITLAVGDANVITIKSDGTLVLNAAKQIVIAAGEKVTLQAGGASLNVGPGVVLSNPPIDAGGSADGDAPSVVQKAVENLVNKGTDWRKWLASGAGFAAKWAEQKLHFYEAGKKLVDKAEQIPQVKKATDAVQNYFSDEAIQQRKDDPMTSFLQD